VNVSDETLLAPVLVFITRILMGGELYLTNQRYFWNASMEKIKPELRGQNSHRIPVFFPGVQVHTGE
jgi:hypothetical protein